MYSVAVHPSGKLALSAGMDKTLRTWNLMTAKNAYVTNIKEGRLPYFNNYSSFYVVPHILKLTDN